MLVSNPILKMFGRSPIKPLQQHIAKSCEAVTELIHFINAVQQNDWQLAQTYHKKVVDCENAADTIKKDIRAHLPKSLFLPVSRGDLLEILTIQDMIANKAKDIAGLILGRHMQIPKPFADSYSNLLNSSYKTAKLAHTAVSELEELLETGFRGVEVDVVEDMIHRLDEEEHANDEIQIEIRLALFKIEPELSPVDVVFLYKMIEWTGDIADHAHQVGSLLQLLMAR